jgi:hypothetical protein
VVFLKDKTLHFQYVSSEGGELCIGFVNNKFCHMSPFPMVEIIGINNLNLQFLFWPAQGDDSTQDSKRIQDRE